MRLSVKSSSLILLATALTSCGYGSMAEARIACGNWASQKKTFQYSYIYKTGRYWEPQVRGRNDRTCTQEKETKKFLGWEYPYDGKLPVNENPEGKSVVVKRFNY